MFNFFKLFRKGEKNVEERKMEERNIEEILEKTKMARQIKRIFGTENEYGTGEVNSLFEKITGFLPNGGKLYPDSGHIEYASPETTNPRDAVIFEKAGEQIAQKCSSRIIKNNVDAVGTTYGAHENYFTNATQESLRSIVPFLVSRQIYAGVGWLRLDGVYEISQRSQFMTHAVSSHTTSSRGILCTKDESHSNLQGWKRLHLILGDANMCEVADFLKLGTTSLVIALVEDGKLPSVGYDPFSDTAQSNAVNDIINVSRDWKAPLKCASSGLTSVIVQRLYLEAAKENYKGMDSVNDQVLNLWEDTLDKLASDPRELFGRVDWVTKKELIDSYAQRHTLDMKDKKLRNIDLQYHDVNRSNGLFYVLQKAGRTERITTDEEIERAVSSPPNDTRAYARGTLIGKYPILRGRTDWSSFTLPISGKVYCSICSGYHDGQQSKQIFTANPFEKYDELINQIDGLMGDKK